MAPPRRAGHRRRDQRSEVAQVAAAPGTAGGATEITPGPPRDLDPDAAERRPQPILAAARMDATVGQRVRADHLKGQPPWTWTASEGVDLRRRLHPACAVARL